MIDSNYYKVEHYANDNPADWPDDCKTDYTYRVLSKYTALTTTAPTIAMTKGGGNTSDGNPQIGDTLTATPSPENATPVTYQWYRGTTAISGATDATYTVVADDLTNKIHVVISQAANSGGENIPPSDIVATSVETAVVKKHDGPDAPGSASVAGFLPIN